MRKHAVVAAALVFTSAPVLLAPPAASEVAPKVVRKLLAQMNAPGGNTLSLVEVTMPPGSSEGMHTHPGPLIVHVLSGADSLDYEGKPTITYYPGQSFTVEPNRVHQGRNRGAVPVVAIATYVTPKGEPVTKQQ